MAFTDEQLLDKLIASIETDRATALATVVYASGSYVNALGNRALIWSDDSPAGDLNLGNLTPQVQEDCRRCLETRRPQMLTYRRPNGRVEIFVEVQRSPPTFLIVGAGHVALPLARLGKLIDFKVVVLDDRPRFANKKRFPMADLVVARPFKETLRNWPIDSDTYIVLVTRGHSHDVDCLLEVIDSPARYIGMIGSKRRVKAVFDLLEQEKGLEPAKLDRVYAPIGLDIGAETPAEIAVAVLAEVINLYRGGRASSLSDAVRADRRLPLHPGRVENKSMS